MEKQILIVFFSILSFCLFSQKHDNVWLLGYAGGSQSPGNPNFGITIIDFSIPAAPSYFNNQEIEMNFCDTSAGICDDEGNLLFYTNGIFINDASHTPMENGENINVWEESGQDLPQGSIALPIPDQSNKFVVLHEVEDGLVGLGAVVSALEYSIIDMNLNNGLGAVTVKKEHLILDTLDLGKLTATKHANGRDWWILVREYDSNRFYKILLSPQGLELVDVQALGLPTTSGLGQAVFSPNGNTYANFNTISIQEGQVIDIYDFDRCTGLLSNHNQINYNENAFSGGIAISSNSRFLYVSSFDFIYQFDLGSSDIEASKITVAEYDGFTNPVPIPTRFYQAQIAADEKIYLSAPNAVFNLHVIHNPNEQGLACNVEQHGIELPTRNSFALPNYPNYRLGALEDSPCDTIVSIKTPKNNSLDLNIYPNPATDFFRMDLPSEFSYKKGELCLYNALGQQTQSYPLKQGLPFQEFSVEDLKAGIYFYEVNLDGSLRANGKLFIQ